MTSSSFEYPDVTYYFLGAEEGKYAKWLCTYYSKSKGETVLVEYDEGVLESDTPFEIGEYGYLTYDSIDYPSDLEGIVDSTLIYDYAVEKGLDIDKNYVNMYLANTQDYGFVWKVDERDMEEEDEYGTGILVNSYIFKTSGEFVTISR
jgi:hypothetical protein